MPLFRQMPGDASLRHPAGLVATWFGVGLARFAPGTWGSLAALPFAGLIVWSGGDAVLLAAAALVFAVGIWAAAYVGRSGRHDDAVIVIDEVMGQWLALVPVAHDLRYYVVAFLLFRLFDIAKPWPASWIDRRLRTPAGVMLDDLVAGVYAGLAVWLLSLYAGYEPCFPGAVPVFR